MEADISFLATFQLSIGSVRDAKYLLGVSVNLNVYESNYSIYIQFFYLDNDRKKRIDSISSLVERARVYTYCVHS